jgi:hypothetical protein
VAGSPSIPVDAGGHVVEGVEAAQRRGVAEHLTRDEHVVNAADRAHLDALAEDDPAQEVAGTCRELDALPAVALGRGVRDVVPTVASAVW